MAQALDRPALRPGSAARLAVPIGGAATTAVLLWASSPAVGVGWLAWVGLVPAAAAALHGAGTRAGRLVLPLTYAIYLELLLVPALPFGLTRNQWGDEPVIPILVGDSPVLVVAILAVPAFGWLLYALRFPDLGRTTGAAAVLVPATAWTALEVLRVKFDPGGLFGPLFLSQSGMGTAGLGAVAGPWLLTFALVAVNYAVALALVRRRGARLLLAAPLGAAAAFAATPAADSLVVAAVQPGYDTSEFERPFLRRFQRRDYEPAALDLIEDLAPLTRAAARRGARLVVWPEAALWIDPGAAPRPRAALARLARETGATIVVPYFLRRPARSAALLALPDGSVSLPQPKHRPMWFLGEHAGEGSERALQTPLGTLGTMLGVDNQDPGVPRKLAARGARLVTSSTHDWRELAPHQRSLSQLHSAALRLPIVRADWRYGSAIYDRGRVVADAGGAKSRTVVVGRVSLADARTPYTRVGDLAAWATVAGALGLAVLRRRTSAG